MKEDRLGRSYEKEHWEEARERQQKVMALLGELMEATNHGHGDPTTLYQASIISGVLREKHFFDDLNGSAVDLVQAVIEGLCDDIDVHAWNNYLLAPIVWMIAAGCDVGMEAAISSITLAIKNLCTEGEWKSFLMRHGLDGGEPEEDSKWARDEMAAYKLARYIAHPDTPADLRLSLQASIYELTTQLQICADHPALVERAASLAFEQVKKGSADVRQQVAKQLYDDLHKRLDELPDLPGEKK